MARLALAPAARQHPRAVGAAPRQRFQIILRIARGGGAAAAAHHDRDLPTFLAGRCGLAGGDAWIAQGRMRPNPIVQATGRGRGRRAELRRQQAAEGVVLFQRDRRLTRRGQRGDQHELRRLVPGLHRRQAAGKFLRLLRFAAASVSYTHLRAHETPEHLVCRLLLEKKKTKN